MVKVSNVEVYTYMHDLCAFLSGVEKNDAKRNHFSSNIHDVTGEVLKAEWQLEQTETSIRTKRKYNKKDENYW